jgi:hypothetical protein
VAVSPCVGFVCGSPPENCTGPSQRALELEVAGPLLCSHFTTSDNVPQRTGDEMFTETRMQTGLVLVGKGHSLWPIVARPLPSGQRPGAGKHLHTLEQPLTTKPPAHGTITNLLFAGRQLLSRSG